MDWDWSLIKFTGTLPFVNRVVVVVDVDPKLVGFLFLFFNLTLNKSTTSINRHLIKVANPQILTQMIPKSDGATFMKVLWLYRQNQQP